MTSLAARERADLCDLALAVGPDAPTLCEGWAVQDLIAHLVLRDGSLAAIGIVVPALADLTDRGMAKLLAKESFEELVSRLRGGPPAYSPFRIPPVERLTNTMEYFIHLEDIRRAQPDWEPRDLTRGAQDAIWRGVTATGRGLVRKAPVGVTVSRTDTGASHTLKRSSPSVTVAGPPAEVAMFVYGRKARARVDLQGDEQDVAALLGTSMGI